MCTLSVSRVASVMTVVSVILGPDFFIRLKRNIDYCDYFAKTV